MLFLMILAPKGLATLPEQEIFLLSLYFMFVLHQVIYHGIQQQGKENTRLEFLCWKHYL